MTGSNAGARRVSAAVFALGITTILAGFPTLALARADDVQAKDSQEQPSLAEDNGVGDIIVTAQRREENMQDVPISVTAITGETLAASGVGGTGALTLAVPSVKMTQSGPGAIFFIRGVGNTSGSVGEEGANAFYVDGVYLGDLTSIAATKFNDIQRIEVLKGPQGTLFGRNSSGGLVNIITLEPGNDFTAQGKVGYGNYDTYQGQLYVSTPLVEDKLAINVALTGKKQNNGFGTNFATGEGVQKGWYYGARSKLLFRPDDATKIVLSGDYYKDSNDYANGFNLFKGTVGVGGYRYPGDYNINTVEPEFAHIRMGGAALTIEHDFDWATLTSISSYHKVHAVSAFDADYSPARLTRLTITSSVRSLQQEIRLASASTTPLSWQVGAFYYNANATVDPFQIRGLGLGGLDSGYDLTNTMRTKSYAAFGEASYDITPSTHLTGGLRYTNDKRSLTGFEVPINQAAGSPFAAAFNIPLTHQSFSAGKVTYRIALRQDLSDGFNIYASYNRGFKSGLYATTGSPKDPPVKPQTIDAFEVGLKSQFLDNRVRFNLAGFHYKIDDYQVRASPSAGQTLLLNAASVKVDGVEGELAIAPVEGLQINATATYLNSRFSKFTNSIISFPLPATCAPPLGPGSTGAPTGGALNCVGDVTGNQTPLSPKFASTLGATYTADLGDRSQLIFNALWSHSSKIYFEPDNRLNQPAYDVVNLSFELKPNENWGIELWASNIFDEHYYYTGVSSGAVGDHGELAAPRTYGVNIKFDY